MHPIDLHLSQKDLTSLGNVYAQMHARDQAIAYSPGLHISRAINVKIVADKICP